MKKLFPSELSTFGTCFVATATYEDGTAPEVQLLRVYRDTVLRSSFTGRCLIRLYYLVGPYAAWIVSRSPALRSFVRPVLDRVVTAIERRTGLERSHFVA